jgi:hypothetical protein
MTIFTSRKTRDLIITRALARIPRSGSLHDDVRAESAVLIKKVRPLLHGFRLGSVVRALFLLATEYAAELLKVEAESCDCIHDIPNGLSKCNSNRQHAVNDIVEENINAER